MAAFLYGVSATDALTFGAAAGAMIVVGVVASYLPARKATRVDPLVAPYAPNDDAECGARQRSCASHVSVGNTLPT